MMLSEILVIALMLNTAFFLWQIQKLTNKLMSRNYGEYVTSDKYQPSKAAPEKTAEQIQAEFAADLAELNRLG